MVGQEDKENNLVFSSELSTGGSLPQTPQNLLKRTRSNVLKTNVLGGKLGAVAGGKDHVANRLPLGQKDKNSSKNFIQMRNKHLGDIKYTKDQKKLKKYGSVLGISSVPKSKSLILKDLEDSDGEKKRDNDSEDDDLENVISMKLSNALSSNNKNEDGLQKGIFSDGRNLRELIRESNEDNDFEIEYKSVPQKEIPFIPTGHISLNNDDFAKLITTRSIFADDILEENQLSENDKSPKLMALNSIDSDDNEVENLELKEQHTMKLNTDVTTEILHIEPAYGGGLSPSELESLIDL